MDLETRNSLDGEDEGDATDEEIGGVEGEEAERPHTKRKYAIFAGFGLLILLALWLLAGHGGDDEAAEAATQVARVTVLRPGNESVVREISATGTLAARKRTPIGVVGEGRRVTRVLVDQGDWVKQGQTLATIDRSVQTQQLEAAEAQIDVARADLQLAQNELDRALALVDRGFISQADVDRKRATRDSTAARVRAARANAAELRARNARLSIYAPASGIILSRDVEVGQVVSGGSALFEMAEGGELELNAELSEEDLARLSVGTPAIVTPVGTDVQVEGAVWQIAPTINEQTRQGVARIALPYSEQLRPGGFANVTIRAGAVNAPLLPETAVLNDDEGSYVYVVGKDSRVERCPVEVGLVTETGVAITSGLDGNERVVLRAGGFLNPGERIEPRLVRSAD